MRGRERRLPVRVRREQEGTGGRGRGRASAHAPLRPARPRSVGVVGDGWLWSGSWLPKAQLGREERLHSLASSRDVSQVC